MGILRQTSFGAGELSPDMYARTDVGKYSSGLRTCRNFIVTQHGNAVNRPGSKFVHEVKDSTAQVRFIPFKFSNDQAYVLEFGFHYIRFYTNGGLVLATGSPTWSNATTYALGEYVTHGGQIYKSIQSNNTNHQPDISPTWWSDPMPLTTPYEVTTSYGAADITHLKFAQSGDTVFLACQGVAFSALKRVSNIHWVLTSWVIGSPTIDAPGGLAIGTTAAAPDPADPTGHPQKLWLWCVTSVNQGGMESLNTSFITTAEPGAVLYTDRTPTKLTWTAVTGATAYRIYRGLLTALIDLTNAFPMCGFISEVVGTTFTDEGLTPDFFRNPPTGTHPFDGENPAVVAIHDGRLVLANSASYPGRVVLTKVGNFRDIDASIVPLASDGIDITLASVGFEEIRSLLPLGLLYALTTAAHWTISGPQGAALTADDTPQAHPQFFSGVNWLDPIPIGIAYLSVQERGTVVRDIQSSLRPNASGGFTNGYTGDDLSVLSRHLFAGHTLVSWAFARDPYYVVWCVRDDGVLLTLTYLKEQEIWAWARHDTDGKVEQVCVIPEGTEDAVYLVVNRTIGGATKRYVERMATRQISDVRLSVFLDCAVTGDFRNYTTNRIRFINQSGYTAGSTGTIQRDAGNFIDDNVVAGDWIIWGPDIMDTHGNSSATRFLVTSVSGGVALQVEALDPVRGDFQGGVWTTGWAAAHQTVSGLAHLEGKSVTVLGDGDVQGPFTVSGGAITLSTPAAVLAVGLPYTSDLETLDMAIPQSETRTMFKAVKRVWFEVAASRGLFAGVDTDHLFEWKQRDVPVGYGTVQLSTELVEVFIEQDWNRGGRAVLRQVDPLPLTVLSFVREYETGAS